MTKRIIAALPRLAPAKKTLSRGAAAVVVIVALSAALPSGIVADSSPDFEIPNGHFYSQANGLTTGSSQKGYAITDDDGLPFWSTYRRLGGVQALGYPISHRFTWLDRTTQVTQRAVLQWHEETEQVEPVNILDYLSQLGEDEWLRKSKSIPKLLAPFQSGSDQGSDNNITSHLALLEQDAGIDAFYQANPNAGLLFGLPTSAIEQFGGFAAMRFQRTAIQRWVVDTAEAKADAVTVANAGDIAKELGLFPREAMEPGDVPSAGQRFMGSSRGAVADAAGLATWYGGSFHGRLMRNQEPYDMYDSSIAAANIYPLGTLLRVTSLATGDSIVVRVSDTGAFRSPIVVDLSWAAFAKLGDPDDGVMEVHVEPLRG